MSPDEKRKYAYDLKQSGKTDQEISHELGCTVQRAHQLIETHERHINLLESKNKFVQKLTHRMPLPPVAKILRSLKNEFGDIDKIDPDKVANLGPSKILEMVNIGPKSIRHIAEALESVGSIKSAREWLSPVEKEITDTKTETIIRWIVQNVTADDIPENASDNKALVYNLAQLAKYGRPYKDYHNEPNQEVEIDELFQKYARKG